MQSKRSRSWKIVIIALWWIGSAPRVWANGEDYGLELKLSSPKADYVIAEPIFLNMALIYSGTAPRSATVPAAMDVQSGLLRVYVSHNGGEDVLYNCGIQSDGGVRKRTLARGERVLRTEILAYDYGLKDYVLSATGEYSFWAEDPFLRLKSNILKINVREPDEPGMKDIEGFKRLELMRYLAFEHIGGGKKESQLREMQKFVGDGAETVYQKYVAAYLGCYYSCRETKEASEKAVGYLEMVIDERAVDFPPRKYVINAAMKSYALTEQYVKCRSMILTLKEEFAEDGISKRVTDKDIKEVDRRIEETK